MTRRPRSPPVVSTKAIFESVQKHRFWDEAASGKDKEAAMWMLLDEIVRENSVPTNENISGGSRTTQRMDAKRFRRLWPMFPNDKGPFRRWGQYFLFLVRLEILKMEGFA